MTFITKNKKDAGASRGFTILYAILITTVVLTIGLSLLGVLIQQISLSGLERESMQASSATDSGMECALYADAVSDAFRQGWTVPAPMPCNTAISCDGVSITPSGPTSAPFGPGKLLWTCTFTANFPQVGCANIKIDKVVTVATGAVSTTTVESRGYNTVCPPAVSPKPWRMERGLQTIY